MHILMITPHYPPDSSGVGDYTALLAEALTRQGSQVAVVTSNHRRSISLSETTTVRVLPIIADWGWFCLPQLCAVAMQGQYDVVHVQYQNEMYNRSASITALPLLLKLLSPSLSTVVTVHDYGTPWPRYARARVLAGPYGKAWFLAMLLVSARIILTNEQDEWRFLRQRPRYPMPASRYATIPIGSNLPVVPSPVGEEGPTLSVGYFGFVNPAKGVDVLLNGFAAAYHQRPTLRLVMVCALQDDDAYHKTIRLRIDALSLGDVVRVTGRLNATVAATTLAQCALIALPFRDGISLRRTTLMAALALGRPTISTRSVVPPGILRDGRDVVLIPRDDSMALERAILNLASDPTARARLAVNAREAARSFEWAMIATRTIELYQDVSARASRGRA